MENITLQNAIALLKSRRATDWEVNNQFYADDHLQIKNNYRGYIGVMPGSGDAEYAFVVEWLKRIFAATNLIKSAVNRNLDGILTREPDWSLVLPDAASDVKKETLSAEVDAAVIDWWNDQAILQNVFREAGRIVLLEGEAYIRPIIPFGLRRKNKTSPAEFKKDLKSALDILDFEIVTADKAGIFTDKETGKKFSVCHLDTDATEEVEISWIGDDGLTYLKILRTDDFSAWANETFPTLAAYILSQPFDPETTAQPLDLGGRLYLHKVFRTQLVTEPARSLQRSVNYALTTMNKNLNIAGSRDTYVTNAKPPKKKVETKDADGNILSTTEIDTPIIKGASNANFLAGFPRKDENGRVIDYAPVGVVTVDPVAVDTFVKAFEVYEKLFLNEVGQSHILSNDSVAVSGKSRQEARGEFKISLKATKTAIDGAGRYVLDFALKLAAAFSNRQIDFADARFDFNSQMTVGAIDMEEVRQSALDVKEGRLSLFSYLVAIQTEDPNAELERMSGDESYQLAIMSKRLETVNLSIGHLTRLEQRRLIFPDKTDDELQTELLLLAKEVGLQEEDFQDPKELAVKE